MSLVRRFEEGFGADSGLSLNHADRSGILRHDDARDDDALDLVFPAIQRAMSGEIRKPPANTKVFDACQPGNERVGYGNRFGQRRRQTDRHSAPPKLIPEEFPAGERSCKGASLANQFGVALRQFARAA